MSFPIVYVKNLPYLVSTDALYDLFGQHGSVHQIRIPETANGTCFVIFHSLQNAKEAAQRLNGVNFEGRYLITTMYQVDSKNLEGIAKLDGEKIEALKEYLKS